MFTNRFGHTAAAVFCTILFSATCVLGAVGPATTHGAQAAVMVERASA
jgi:hypothetical protein